MKPTSFCADAKHWEVCVLYSFGDHWNAAKGLIHSPNSGGKIGILEYFCLPMCHTRNDNWTTVMISNTLRDAIPLALRSTVSGRSARYGGTTLLHEHPLVFHSELTAWSGHTPPDNPKY